MVTAEKLGNCGLIQDALERREWAQATPQAQRKPQLRPVAQVLAAQALAALAAALVGQAQAALQLVGLRLVERER